jgi:hypothetical protein
LVAWATAWGATFEDFAMEYADSPPTKSLASQSKCAAFSRLVRVQPCARSSRTRVFQACSARAVQSECCSMRGLGEMGVISVAGSSQVVGGTTHLRSPDGRAFSRQSKTVHTAARKMRSETKRCRTAQPFSQTSAFFDSSACASRSLGAYGNVSRSSSTCGYRCRTASRKCEQAVVRLTQCCGSRGSSGSYRPELRSILVDI